MTGDQPEAQPAPSPEEKKTEAEGTGDGMAVANRPTLPKIRTVQVPLPSGASGRIRQLTVTDLDRMLDPMLARSGQQLMAIVEDVWQQTEDPGPYTLDGGGRMPWGNVAQVDIMAIIVGMRQASMGDDYNFQASCPHPGCGTPIDWVIKCSELVYAPMTKEARQSIASGEGMIFTFPQAEVQCWHHVLTCTEANRIGAPGHGRKQEWNVDALCTRIDKIDGVGDQDRRYWLRHLAVDDHIAFGNEVDRLEGGHELDFEIECQKCSGAVDVGISKSPDFLLGARRKRRARP